MAEQDRSVWPRDAVVRSIRAHRIISVIRTPSRESAEGLIDALIEAGLHLIEVTLTTPEAADIIRGRSGNPEICVGAGTVMNPEDAALVIDAGARFVIAPYTDPETVAFCRSRSITVIPGTLTPSEVARAWSLGPDFVKVFPIAAMGGAKYLRAIRGPLPLVPIIPTGAGLDRDNIPDLFDAGAVAVGVSDGLATAEEIREGRWAPVTERARDLRAVVEGLGNPGG
ncbi:MAG: bifunctional 4-hydroxy-2-oxoglutarate aldolase/2-dehydro-3-deoxy-phosphogluconate aldolase [Planctomycetota bacterium]|nr:bifunctional 4-hydroxy-2-oxoglutarate aldolase/2-dehydro-3-deoxy-phosphogluconate aldolase [Planctomycetota bacterium]